MYQATNVFVLNVPIYDCSVKMIHTIARYFSTTERMTLLLSKISNQLIRNCKLNICQRKTDADLWSMKSETLNATMEDCLRLNEVRIKTRVYV